MERIRIHVDPHAIERALIRRSPWEKLRFGLSAVPWNPVLLWGGWDQRTVPFRAHPAYRLLETLERADYDPDATWDSLIQYYRARGHRDPEANAARKQDEYLRTYRAVAENMRRNGYRADAAQDDIGIAIARDGTLVKTSGGNHRLALAQIVGLPWVVAAVSHVHLQWFRARERSDHPARERIAAGLKRQGWRLWEEG